MEVITSNPEVIKQESVFCEICDRSSIESDQYKCEDKNCHFCSLTFDRFVCLNCTHTKSLEEMEEIYLKKSHFDEKNDEPVSDDISPSMTNEETRNITDAIEDLTENISDFEDSEVDEVRRDTKSSTVATIDEEPLYSVLPADTDDELEEVKTTNNFEKSVTILKELNLREDENIEATAAKYREELKKSIKENAVTEVKFEKEEKPSKLIEEEVKDERKEREEYERVIQAIGELNKEEIAKISAEVKVESQIDEVVEIPVHLNRQNGIVEEIPKEESHEEVLEYRGPIPLRVRKNAHPKYYEETNCSSDSESIDESDLIKEEEIIENSQQTKVRYFDDYQEEEDDSGTEADINVVGTEEELTQAHHEEILQGIPEDDEVSLAANCTPEETVKATLVKSDLDRQDSALTYTSVDKFYEERDFANVSNDYIRGTSLEDYATSSVATPLIEDEVVRPGSPIEYDSSEVESEDESEYENEYYPLYEHIKAQKCINRDIRMLRSMLEEKFKIKIISNEMDEVVRAKEEIYDKFGLDLGYPEVYNYLERNRLNKRVNQSVDKAIALFSSIGIKMSKTEKSEGLGDDEIQDRIMKICDYVDEGKSIDEIPNSKTDEAVKLACKYFEETLNLKMIQNRKSWREKQEEVIDLMNRYHRKSSKEIAELYESSSSESEEEEDYSEMTENFSRFNSCTPISFKTSPNSDKVEAIDEGVERVRRTFGKDHEIRLNALVSITDDLKENIEKLSKLFPGKIKFEIETIPKAINDTITEFRSEIKEDLQLAEKVVEKTLPSNEKFDIAAFFKNLFTKKTETQTA